MGSSKCILIFIDCISILPFLQRAQASNFLNPSLSSLTGSVKSIRQREQLVQNQPLSVELNTFISVPRPNPNTTLAPEYQFGSRNRNIGMHGRAWQGRHLSKEGLGDRHEIICPMGMDFGISFSPHFSYGNGDHYNYFIYRVHRKKNIRIAVLKVLCKLRK